jgi:hypothetical protein
LLAEFELLIHPVNEMTPMSTLNLLPGIANGDVLPQFSLKPVSFLVQKEVSQHNQSPEAANAECVKDFETLKSIN